MWFSLVRFTAAKVGMSQNPLRRATFCASNDLMIRPSMLEVISPPTATRRAMLTEEVVRPVRSETLAVQLHGLGHLP